jgi:hypothetical protein
MAPNAPKVNSRVRFNSNVGTVKLLISIVQFYRTIEYLKYRNADSTLSTMRTPVHPHVEELRLEDVLYALGNPMRLGLVRQLADSTETKACGDLYLGEAVPKSTGSHVFKVLRESGLIRMTPQGRRLLISLRRNDLEQRFPGLLDAVLKAGDPVSLGIR